MTYPFISSYSDFNGESYTRIEFDSKNILDLKKPETPADKALQPLENRVTLSFGNSEIKADIQDIAKRLGISEKEIFQISPEQLGERLEIETRVSTSAANLTGFTGDDIVHSKEILREAFSYLFSGESKKLWLQTKSGYQIKVNPKKGRIKALFGEKISEGTFGAVFSKHVFIGPELKKPVLKIPKNQAISDLQNEKEILEALHGDKTILGIQLPVTLQTITYKHQKITIYKSPQYDKNLFDVIKTLSKDQSELNLEDTLSIAYQLFYGLRHMHHLNITNGDIKAENIFVNNAENDQKIIRVFLSDFGAAINHNKTSLDKTPPPKSYKNTSHIYFHGQTSGCCIPNDNIARVKALQEKDRDSFIEIVKKADITALCIALCEAILQQNVCYLDQYKFIMKPREDLEHLLTRKEISKGIVSLILKGLSLNYKNRPNADEFLSPIMKQLKSINMEFARQLEKLKTESSGKKKVRVRKKNPIL